MPKKPLNDQEKEAARRLRRIWDARRRELGLTQERVAHLCGWSAQSAFAAYLGGKNALNVEAVVKLANVLKVSPDDIWPGLVPLPPPLADVRVSDEALRLAVSIDLLSPEDRGLLRSLIETFLSSKGVSLGVRDGLHFSHGDPLHGVTSAHSMTPSARDKERVHDK